MTITRQDLEDAAKSAGNELQEIGGVLFFGRQAGWNPIKNKADLWDLAEKCRLTIDHETGVVVFPKAQDYKRFTQHNHESCAEAVILAAAEIWRAKK